MPPYQASFAPALPAPRAPFWRGWRAWPPALVAACEASLATRAALMVLVALVLRGPVLGHATIHVDEEFYLLVGDRMVQGALPYVDIWDRKPVGLFLLFAGFRLLGGDGFAAYQLPAALCVVGTALAIYRAARLIAPPAGALAAAVAYQLYLSVFFCFGGQSPVFYNLPVAAAGLMVMSLWHQAPSLPARRLLAGGAGAMALIGLAIQIKYTVVFEGLAFGLALMALARHRGWGVAAVLGAAALWAGLALAPTLAAWGWYAAHGHGAQFVQANFLSIFARHTGADDAWWRLTKEGLVLAALWWALWAARPAALAQRAGVMAACWAAASLGGFLLFGTWYDHYVAPLLVPLMVLAAPALAAPRRALALLGLGALAAGVVTTVDTINHPAKAQAIASAARIHAAAGQGCVYIHEADPVLYYLAGNCLATRYPFPDHLNALGEATALGVPVMDEVARVIARRPAAIVISPKPLVDNPNLAVRARFEALIARDYQPAGTIHMGGTTYRVYRRKVGTAQPAPRRR